MTTGAESEVYFEAGGKTYTLKFTTRSIVKLEKLMKTSLGSIMADSDFFSVRGLLLWAALLDHHPQITEDDAHDLMDTIGQKKTVALIGEAWSVSKANPANETDQPASPQAPPAT